MPTAYLQTLLGTLCRLAPQKPASPSGAVRGDWRMKWKTIECVAQTHVESKTLVFPLPEAEAVFTLLAEVLVVA